MVFFLLYVSVCGRGLGIEGGWGGLFVVELDICFVLVLYIFFLLGSLG